ncbi:MAG TPA: DUF4357 domain-containing protein [Verrucomicrobiae bacterium]|jgi:hypothetical protein|nr:DUF4357 domain-containing protein [Verrucomicrobiae bacterium]
MCHCILSHGKTAVAVTLVCVAIPLRSHASVAVGPTYTNTTASEQRRLAQFYQAEQSFQEKLRVGRERYKQKQTERAKIIAAMSSEFQARQQTVVIQPLEPPRVNPDLPVGWFHSSMFVGVFAAGLLGFVSFLNRERLQEALLPDPEPLEPEQPVVVIPIREQIFLCEGEGASARGMYRDDGFLILKGSIGRKEDPPSAEDQSAGQAEITLLAAGIVCEDGDSVVFQEDHLFRSPSIAASALLGRTANGWVEWKNKDGTTLDTVARQQQID